MTIKFSFSYVYISHFNYGVFSLSDDCFINWLLDDVYHFKCWLFRHGEPDFLYDRTWIPWFFFSAVVTFGSIGRQLAMVSKDLTSSSLDRGWVPVVSRSCQFWQPAPRYKKKNQALSHWNTTGKTKRGKWLNKPFTRAVIRGRGRGFPPPPPPPTMNAVHGYFQRKIEEK